MQSTRVLLRRPYLSLFLASACFGRAGRKQLLPQQQKRRGAAAAEWSALTSPHCGSRLLEHIAENSRRKRRHCRFSRQCERVSKEPRLGARCFAPLTALCSCGSERDRGRVVGALYSFRWTRPIPGHLPSSPSIFAWLVRKPRKTVGRGFLFISFPRPFKGNFHPGVGCAQLALRICLLL